VNLERSLAVLQSQGAWLEQRLAALQPAGDWVRQPRTGRPCAAHHARSAAPDGRRQRGRCTDHGRDHRDGGRSV